MEGLANKIIVVCGPTASGKTSLALALAISLDGEMICADSMQIYSGLHIGTASLLPQEAKGVPQHLLAFLPPEQAFSVAEYVDLANVAIQDILSRGKVPIVCGGTGLYIKAVVEGVQFSAKPPSRTLRASLQESFEHSGSELMLERLAQVDPDYAATLHINDKKRILRGLEQWELTQLTRAARDEASKAEKPPYNALCLGLTSEKREDLYKRIEVRVDSMLTQGILQEAKTVFDNRESYQTAAQAIGYKEFFPYFEGDSTVAECAEKLKQATRNYAKRQLTWFKHMPSVQWLHIDEADLVPKALELCGRFLAEESLST